MNVSAKPFAAASLAAIAITGFGACSGEDPGSGARAATTNGAARPPMTTSALANPAADLVGPGCADYEALHPSGPASVTRMARDPVSIAAANNPALSTLTSALSGKLNPNVNLVSTLDNGQYTVFAPTNAAFDKLPAATIEHLKTDSRQLTSILTYHVVKGQQSPNRVDGTHPTVQGTELTVTGAGNNLKVNDAGLVCGGVHTANAAVYMIDTVLMPPGQ